VHTGEVPESVLSRYRAEGGAPVVLDRERVEAMGIAVHGALLLPDVVEREVRHDPARLAAAVLEVARGRLALLR
jgi:hypothetical protein